ncbi:LytR/AlgR family response regulator transcription factor [Pontibacter harenae]|uniref:LytR/AlgR family response regulator transcription factor n=1 Tax=Pontibacter harenae TaxID=2894083 RepID=UPI001E4F1B8C|nr:LytTR family DNA-binding domain-containing protein [Pontibacter harenae]MCC9167730.1 LytTR family DNA-binding domain-containing protein [Pontibacter harenae]
MGVTQYKCVIIDDEPAAHYVLISYIEKNANLILVSQCYNALEALDYIRNNPVDLIFLDIDMPEMSGIEFLKSLSSPPQTILTTAHSQYALESYDYGVIDYLLKPISLSRFIKSIERFLSFHQRDETDDPKNITVKVDGRNIELKTYDINYIQSYGNYVKVFTRQKIYLVSTTTQEILSNLSARTFMRIHKSYIVNLSKVEKYTESEVLINNEKLPIGITFKRELLEYLGKSA